MKTGEITPEIAATLPPCEVCGGPATCEMVDCKETAPKPDEHGALWTSVAVVGDRHAYCDLHERPRFYWRRDGRLEVEVRPGRTVSLVAGKCIYPHVEEAR